LNEFYIEIRAGQVSPRSRRPVMFISVAVMVAAMSDTRKVAALATSSNRGPPSEHRRFGVVVDSIVFIDFIVRLRQSGREDPGNPDPRRTQLARQLQLATQLGER
jgi:hypothetical protein